MSNGNTAEFRIIGNVVKRAVIGKVTKVTVANNYSVKVGEEWEDRTGYNTVNVWSENKQKYLADHVKDGDLVIASGNMEDSKFEKDGATIYTTERNATSFEKLVSPKSS